jgi:hypothetical protein
MRVERRRIAADLTIARDHHGLIVLVGAATARARALRLAGFLLDRPERAELAAKLRDGARTPRGLLGLLLAASLALAPLAGRGAAGPAAAHLAAAATAAGRAAVAALCPPAGRLLVGVGDPVDVTPAHRRLERGADLPPGGPGGVPVAQRRGADPGGLGHQHPVGLDRQPRGSLPRSRADDAAQLAGRGRGGAWGAAGHGFSNCQPSRVGRGFWPGRARCATTA